MIKGNGQERSLGSWIDSWKPKPGDNGDWPIDRTRKWSSCHLVNNKPKSLNTLWKGYVACFNLAGTSANVSQSNPEAV